MLFLHFTKKNQNYGNSSKDFLGAISWACTYFFWYTVLGRPLEGSPRSQEDLRTSPIDFRRDLSSISSNFFLRRNTLFTT
mmetsp:Transcript_3197/g.3618  ORF Transcript_3197/g.3618 Transcript_3197/m.3618 type:complete len:80 (-) Transcript_3197:1512-1751(-)